MLTWDNAKINPEDLAPASPLEARSRRLAAGAPEEAHTVIFTVQVLAVNGPGRRFPGPFYFPAADADLVVPALRRALWNGIRYD